MTTLTGLRTRKVFRGSGSAHRWQAVAWICALLLWWIIASTGRAPASVLPTPADVVIAGADLVQTSDYWLAILDTLANAGRALALSAVTAIPLGLLSAASTFVADSLSFIVDIARSFPSIALLPMLLLAFGATPLTSLIIVTIACAFPLYVQTVEGGRGVTASIRETTTAFRIPGRLFVTKVSLPTAVPAIMTGLRLAATTAVLVSIGCEVLGGINGVGKQLSMSQQFGAAGRTYWYIVTAALLGLAISWLMVKIEKRLLRWRG